MPAQGAGDVVDEHLVVELDRVLQDLRALEHGVAVAAVEQQIVRGSQLVARLGIEGLARDEDIAHSALHRLVDMVEEGVFIRHAGARDGGIDLEAHARGLEEAAGFLRHGMHRPLQRVEHLLTADLDDGQAVAEGIDLEDIAQRDLAPGNGNTDAAAAEEGKVGVTRLIEEGVGAQVAEVGLGAADDAHGLALFGSGGGIVDGEVDGGVGDDLLELFIEILRAFVDSLGGEIINLEQLGKRHAAAPGKKLGADFAVARDVQDTDVVKLGAAGGAVHFPAVLVKHDDLVGIVAVAVKEGVDAAAVGDHITVHPG